MNSSIMRPIALLFAVFIVPLPLPAQQTIAAEDIISQINENQPVNLSDVTVIGDLRLVDVANQHLENSRSNIYDSQDIYHCVVEVPLLFENCTFTGDIVGFENLEQEDKVLNAFMEQGVVFRNCTVEGEMLMKYAEFEREADFSNTRFLDYAQFKYTSFAQVANFNRSEFNDEACFKYTDFREMVNFQQSAFYDEANFKYTKFTAGVNFSNVQFDNFANFKYTKFRDPFSMDGARFSENGNFKYTTLNGQTFKPGY